MRNFYESIAVIKVINDHTVVFTSDDEEYNEDTYASEPEQENTGWSMNPDQIALAMLTFNLLMQDEAMTRIEAKLDGLLDRVAVVANHALRSRHVLLQAIAASQPKASKQARKSRSARKNAPSNQRVGKRA